VVVEIAPVPHRSTRSEWRRLALGLLVLVPVLLLVLLPAVLGLDRYVVTDRAMSGSLGRGSVVLARDVPPGDLRVGDVITFRSPDRDSDHRVTRRIVAIEAGVITTKADVSGSTDPWTLPQTESSYARVWLSLPWLGYPFVMEGGWVLLALAAAGALTLALLAGRRTSQRVVRQGTARLPVG
jgi:signal peptidase I